MMNMLFVPLVYLTVFILLNNHVVATRVVNRGCDGVMAGNMNGERDAAAKDAFEIGFQDGWKHMETRLDAMKELIAGIRTTVESVDMPGCTRD